jgi:hypothetical protein
MDEYRETLLSAVDAACAGDLQALLVAQWMLSTLRAEAAGTGVGPGHALSGSCG